MLRGVLLGALGLLLVLLAREVVRDLTRHRRARALSRIRTAFLHGMALAAPKQGATSEIIWAGLRLEFPSTWNVSTQNGRLECRFPLEGAPTVTALTGGGSAAPDASVEYLSDGRRLSRWVEECTTRGRVAFLWWVEAEQRSWTFRAEIDLAVVDEVTTQADIARLDQVIRSLTVQA